MTQNNETEQSRTGTEQETVEVEIDRVISDSSDLSMLGLEDIGEGCVDLVGEPSDAGFLPDRVSVKGTVEIERYVEKDTE